MPPLRQHHRLFDRLGAVGSLLCAVHCALLPVAIALLPAAGLAGLSSDVFERAFVAFATVLGLSSIAWGYRRHRALRAVALLLPGLSVLWAGLLFQPLHESLVPHAVAMTVGGALVGFAHLANLRLHRGHVHGPACAQR